MDKRRCVDHFFVDGKKCYTGTVFKTKWDGDAVFVCVYYPQYMHGVHIVYRVLSTNTQWMTPIEMFRDKFVCVTDAVDDRTKMPQTKHVKDSQIDGMALGWMWYIFIMAIVTIFKGQIIWWILISVAFFTWRHNKIQKEGTYIEWKK